MKVIREALVHLGAFLVGYYLALLLNLAMPATINGPAFDRTGVLLYLLGAVPYFIGWTVAAWLAGRFTHGRSPLPGALALAALFAVTYLAGLTWGPSIGLGEKLLSLAPFGLALALVVYVYRKVHLHHLHQASRPAGA
jgi:peptidoglycan/LPS O-acetylase OafA/YrhL